MYVFLKKMLNDFFRTQLIDKDIDITWGKNVPFSRGPFVYIDKIENLEFDNESPALATSRSTNKNYQLLSTYTLKGKLIFKIQDVNALNIEKGIIVFLSVLNRLHQKTFEDGISTFTLENYYIAFCFVSLELQKMQHHDFSYYTIEASFQGNIDIHLIRDNEFGYIKQINIFEMLVAKDTLEMSIDESDLKKNKEQDKARENNE